MQGKNNTLNAKQEKNFTFHTPKKKKKLRKKKKRI